MKLPVFHRLPLTFALLCLLNCCDQKAPPQEAQAPGTSTTAQDADPRFGAWSSKAELQFQMERLTPDQYFSKVQGRCAGGINQYQAVVETFPRTEYREWAVFWGLTEKELFDYEITLLRLGFVRFQTQVFTDTSGVALHQLIMLCPVNAVSFDDPPVATLDKSKIDPAIVAGAQNSGQAEEPAVPADQSSAQVTDVASDNADENSEEPTIAEAGKATVVVETPEASTEPTAPKATVVPPENQPKGKVRNHIVVKGDTLSSIARRYRITIAALKSANNLNADALQIKQLLKIPAAN